jgi:toxin-antitoxin system PIN domain toxin
MIRALLDVNVLIALLDTQHVHHQLCRDWLSAQIQYGWASCPLTLNGCIRIMSQPAYPAPLPPAQKAQRLAAAMAEDAHQFWPDDVNPLQANGLLWDSILSSRQITDAYLLALATRHSGRLVTLDRKITTATVAQAGADNLVIINPT